MGDFADCVAVVLAAGKGTRMRSARPKVLHGILGEPMLAWTLAPLKALFGARVIVVVGWGGEEVRQAFPGLRFAVQAEQLGTGHALACALAGAGELDASRLLVINGDAPLITAATIENFLRRADGADLAFATLTLADPGAYGRVWRSGGEPKAVIEAKDFDSAAHGEPTGEVNAGIYLIGLQCARELLPLLGNANRSGEYYLTDLVALAAERGLDVRAVECGRDTSLLGVNSLAELAQAEDMLAARMAGRLLEAGVVIHAPALLRCGPNVAVEPGAEIYAPCEIYGNCRIAAGAVIESHCWLKNSEIAEGARIFAFSHIDGARVGARAKVGPYGRLRPGAALGVDAHVGNFVELKNAFLGDGAKANHLSYLGDAEIGAHVNIGAGTITCNYDGRRKHRTSIGEDAFIGSNTALVAPVRVGARALVGAGSTITKDVPDNELAIARQRQKNLPRRQE